MATLTVNGVDVTVDDSFKSLPPDQQEATVNEIAASLKGGGNTAPPPANANPAAPQLDQYYSTGIYGGAMNPLGPVARSLDAGATAVGDALTSGFGDEISGLWGATDSTRNREKALQASNPIASTVGTLAGGAMGASKLAALGVIPEVAPSASMLAKVGVGAGSAFGLGSLYGLGSGEDGNRAASGLINGGIGAVAGGLLPLAAKGISAGYQSVADNMARNQVAKDAGVTPDVANLLTQTLGADGSLGPQGASNMARAGNEAMLADAGPNARAVLDTTIQRGGPGAVLARDRIDARVGRDSQALTNALDTTLGAPQGLTTANTGIRQGTAAARSSAYDEAYNAPIDYSHPLGVDIEDMVKNRVPPEAISAANKLMRTEGLKSQQIKATIGDDGSITYERLPDVRQLDYITRGLNDVADAADGQGKLGGTTAVGRAYGNLSQDLRGNIKKLVPQYGNALDIASDAISQSKAVKLGANILSPSSTMDDISIATQGMSESEKDALKQGIRSNIENRVANVTRTVADGDTDAREAIKAIKDLSSRANRQKVAAAIGDTDAQKLFDEVDRVAQSFDLRSSMAQNSKTFARQATNEMTDKLVQAGPVATLLQGQPLNAGKRIAQLLTGQTEAATNSRKDAIMSEVADYLTRPASQAIPAFQAMTNYGTQTAINASRANTVARLLSQGRNGVYPTSALLEGTYQRSSRK